MYTIRNEYLTVTLAAKGAELQSIHSNETGHEYMWSGDPAFWGKKSPVLFPIVGGLKNNSYSFNGRSYAMNRHGFAREKEFAVKEQDAHRILFELQDDLQTLEIYPFYFRFGVEYRLDGNSIHIRYTVENTGESIMYFSVGAHPAFAVPISSGTEFTDHYIHFNENETAGRWPLSKDGLIETEPAPLLSDANMIPLTKELFYGDALVFKHLRSHLISIRNHINTHGVEVECTGFPFLGIWSAKDADFVCIEPWCGIADSVTASGELAEKEGIHSLAPAQEFMRSWSIKVF